MRTRATSTTAVVLLSVTALVGCVTTPEGRTKVQLYSAEDGRGVFIGRFGPSVPSHVVLQLRVVGAIAGGTFCVSFAALDTPPPAFFPAASASHPTACQFVPVAAGDLDIELGPFGPGWDESVDGPLEGRWYWASVTVELPQSTQVPLTGVRDVVVDGTPATPACVINPGVMYPC